MNDNAARATRPGPRTMARICGALLGALALAAPAIAREACHITKLEMPVTLVGGRAVATVGIGGQQVPLTVDSGAFFSMLSDGAAQQLGLELGPIPFRMRVQGLTGEIEAQLTTVPELQFTQARLKDVEFMVGGNQVGGGTVGLLGRNLLFNADIEFDLADGMVRLMFPTGDCDDIGMAYWAGDKPVTELKLVRDYSQSKLPPPIVAMVTVNGKRLRALFDTGAHSALSLDAAHAAGIADADMKRDGVIYGAGAGAVKAWTARVASLEIGDESIANSMLSVADFTDDGQDMLLGIDFFLSHRIYVSKRQHRMYLTYNGGPVFARNKVSAQEQAAAASAAAGEPAEDAEALVRRGAARAARKDYAGALSDLDRACALAPQMASCFTRRGEVHLALAQPDRARADFDTALALDPSEWQARLMRTGLNLSAHHRDAALADLQALDNDLPAQADMRAAMARLYETLDLPAQALRQWDQWLPAHPHEVGRASALNASCWLRLGLGPEADLDRALADCDAAIDQAEKKTPEFFDSRGWVQLRRGQWKDARRDFDRALALEADQAWSLYGRSLAHARLNEADASRADIEAARKAQPDIDDKVRRSGVAGPLALPASVAAAPASAVAN